MFFTNLPRSEIAAGMLAEKLPATISTLGLGKDGSMTKSQLWRNVKRICNLFQAQEVAIQSRVGGPEIAFGL